MKIKKAEGGVLRGVSVQNDAVDTRLPNCQLCRLYCAYQGNRDVHISQLAKSVNAADLGTANL